VFRQGSLSFPHMHLRNQSTRTPTTDVNNQTCALPIVKRFWKAAHDIFGRFLVWKELEHGVEGPIAVWMGLLDGRISRPDVVATLDIVTSRLCDDTWKGIGLATSNRTFSRHDLNLACWSDHPLEIWPQPFAAVYLLTVPDKSVTLNSLERSRPLDDGVQKYDGVSFSFT
jgi:hypothetical protein